MTGALISKVQRFFYEDGKDGNPSTVAKSIGCVWSIFRFCLHPTQDSTLNFSIYAAFQKSRTQSLTIRNIWDFHIESNFSLTFYHLPPQVFQSWENAQLQLTKRRENKTRMELAGRNDKVDQFDKEVEEVISIDFFL